MTLPSTQSYVERWFISIEELAALTGASVDQVEALVAAGAAPGPIYVRSAETWWNALDDEPAIRGGEQWYASAAAYWIRRARLTMRSGADEADAARMNYDHFAKQFVAALPNEPLAAVPFADAISNGQVDLAAASKRAAAEWADWTNGGYAVCLRSFTGQTCVEKEALAYYLRRTDPDPVNQFDLLDLVERLSMMILPFAPFQRPNCTPGFAVDRLLSAMALGKDDPYRGLAL